MVNYILQNSDSLKVDSEVFENNYQCVSGQSFLFERSFSGGCVENKFFNVLRYDTDRLVKQNK
jgi:hypothetical protein